MRIALQAFFVGLPLLMYLAYRVFLDERPTFARGWPLTLLLGIGLALSLSFYVLMYALDPAGDRTCYAPSRFENGRIISGEVVPCADPSRDMQFDNPPPETDPSGV